MDKPLTSAYEEGFGAYISGKTMNPYNYHSEKWFLWQRGYNTAGYFERMNEVHPTKQMEA